MSHEFNSPLNVILNGFDCIYHFLTRLIKFFHITFTDWALALEKQHKRRDASSPFRGIIIIIKCTD